MTARDRVFFVKPELFRCNFFFSIKIRDSIAYRTIYYQIKHAKEIEKIKLVFGYYRVSFIGQQQEIGDPISIVLEVFERPVIEALVPLPE